MTKQEQINSLFSRLKTASGENYAEIESVATEILELSNSLVSDYNDEVEAHKHTTAESIKRKQKIKELSSSDAEKAEQLKKLDEFKALIEQKDSTIESLKGRVSEYDNDIISKYKERHESFKIGDSEYKKFFDLPENIDDLTVEQARINNRELDKLIELKVFDKKTTDTTQPKFNQSKNDQIDPKSIYNKSDY